MLKPWFPFASTIVGEQAWKFLGLVMGLPVLIILIQITVGFSGFTFSWQSILMTLPAILVGAILFAEMEFIIGISSLWLMKVNGVYLISYLCFEIFGGRIAPFYLLPVWLRNLSDLLPFRYTFSFGVDILQQTVGVGDAFKGLIIAFVWAFVLYLICRFLMKKGLRRYEAVGI